MEKKNLQLRDETVRMDKENVEIVTIDELKIARFTFQLCWTWKSLRNH